jgi:sugar lactone lactonase YvrE
MGMNREIELACKVGAELGEGPVWVERDAALWFVDIKGRHLHRFDPLSGQRHSWDAPEQPGFVVPLRSSGGRDSRLRLLAGLKTGLHEFDPQTGQFTLFATVEPHLPDNRLNDGAVSADGTLWFGSMDDLETRPTGSLYRLGPDGRSVPLDSGYVVTNGPAFSPDARTFYHTDSGQRLVYAFDRDEFGALSNRRVFAQIEPEGGFPDGTAVDAEGCLWIGMWDGWCVRRYSPSGELLSRIRVPCAKVTKVAFGGSDYSSVFVTTAWTGLSPTQRAEQPLAGDLFRFETDVPGLPSTELRL